MITTVKPMSVDHARALTQAYELQRLLEELCERPENGPDSSIAEACEHMDSTDNVTPIRAGGNRRPGELTKGEIPDAARGAIPEL